MYNMTSFSRVFVMMPDHEAAKCLLLLTRNEQLELLGEIKKNRTDFLPPAIAEEQLPSLLSLFQFEHKIGDILMALAELAGDKYADGLINEWAEADPMLLQALREHLFFFEEVICLKNRCLQRVLQEVKLNPLMLIDTSPEVRKKLLTNVSQRVAKGIREEYLLLEDKVQPGPEVYHVKGELSRMVIKSLRSGEIEKPDFFPEATGQECEQEIKA